MHLRRVRPLALAAFVLFARTASAQPSAADVSRAVALFDDAKRALAAGQTPEACHLFVESYRLDPQVGTLLNTALCHEKEGRTASAWAEFTSVVSLATRAGQAKRADFARTRVKALEPKLVRVRFEILEPDPSLEVSVDGTPIAATSIRGGPVPMDPGVHEITAAAPRKKPWKGSLTVPESGPGGSLTIPALENDPTPPAVEPSPTTPPAAPAPVAKESTSSPLRTAAWATAIGGGVALVVGGVGGLLALSAKGTADDGCAGSTCRTPDALSANERAFTWATVSTVGFIATGVLAATSTVLFLVSRRSGSTTARTPELVLRF